MKNRQPSMTRGFTLIEILVVVAIIGLLSAVVMASLNAARERANIAKAKAEADQIMKAAELVLDEYGYYPNDSHGTIVCPKDIIINQTTSKTWGDFVNICNDPWGHPYEWDNQCQGGATRKPHAPYDPTCTSFSETNPGPVGLTILGKDGVNNGCTGDDICTGQRGHTVYGYDGVVTEGGGGPVLACVNLVSDCASLTTVGCVSRDGCTLSANGCTGTYDSSCTSIGDQTSCSAASGCSWSAGGCSGTASACSTYGSSGACSAASGCTWNTTSSCIGLAGSCSLANYGTQSACQGVGCTWGTSSSCGGTVSCSSYNANQASCQGAGCTFNAAVCTGTAAACSTWNGNQSTCLTQTGCTWSSSGGGKCQSTHAACSTYSQASCAGQLNCSWGTSSCTGAPSCAPLSQAQCTYTGCSWSSSNSCTGSPNNCSTYGSSGACGAALGCSWNSTSSCGGSANCSYGDSASCSAGGCTWGTASCQGTHTSSCGGFASQSACTAEPTCSWSEGACTGTATSCTTFGDQNSCNSESGCSWQ